MLNSFLAISFGIVISNIKSILTLKIILGSLLSAIIILIIKIIILTMDLYLIMIKLINFIIVYLIQCTKYKVILLECKSTECSILFGDYQLKYSNKFLY